MSHVRLRGKDGTAQKQHTVIFPDEVDNADAEHFCSTSEATAKEYEDTCRRYLNSGRRSVAAASLSFGEPNVFQTETMNGTDMLELRTSLFKITETADLCIDDVSTAFLHKQRQSVPWEEVLPLTELKTIEFASIRLEIQSGRSYRLHAHKIIQVLAEDDVLLHAVSASLNRPPPEIREKHALISRQKCLSNKFRNNVCVYGYPI